MAEVPAVSEQPDVLREEDSDPDVMREDPEQKKLPADPSQQLLLDQCDKHRGLSESWQTASEGGILVLEDEDQEKLTENVHSLKQHELPEQIRRLVDVRKLKEAYTRAASISILVTGKTGTGKSTLINGILGFKADDKGAAKEGDELEQGCTDEIKTYRTKKGRITVTVWDSPGLQDGTKHQDQYLRYMNEKCTPRDLTIYCIKIDTRFVHSYDNPDVVAMKKLTDKFGNDFWKHTVIVLTFTNTLEAFKPQWKRLPPVERDRAFQEEIQKWVKQIRQILIQDIKIPGAIVAGIDIIPGGHYLEEHLPDHQYWLSSLWFQCLNTLPTPYKRVAFVAINAGRFKTESEAVKNKDIDIPLSAHEQAIVVQTMSASSKLSTGDKTALLSVGGGIAVGAVVGGGLGAIGFVGGPLGAITLPLGIIIGTFIGATGGVVAKAIVDQDKN